MYKIISFLFVFILIISNQVSFAQDGESGKAIEPSHVAKWSEVTNWEKHPRYEDHFWRRKVRLRVDLLDKMNKPQNEASIKIYDENSRVYSSNKDKYDYIEGIISALMSGYANQFMMGYNPDSLDSEVEFNQFRALYRKYTDAGGGAGPEGETTDEGSDEGDDEWDDNSGDEGADASKGSQDKGDALAIPESSSNEFTEIARYYDIIEDRIFDKNKSDMFYEPEYLILYVNRPGGVALPIIAFKYDEIKDTVLSKCMWRNRFNDAEYKTLKEILELRLFGSYVMNMSQYQAKSIDEADRLRLQMLEFEHNLWEF